MRPITFVALLDCEVRSFGKNKEPETGYIDEIKGW